MFAAVENDAAMVEPLLHHGAPHDGEAVMEAARGNCAAALSVLLRHGCSAAWEEHGDSPLVVAARAGNYAVVPLLVAAGADLDHRDDSSTSARIYLERAGRLDLVA